MLAKENYSLTENCSLNSAFVVITIAQTPCVYCFILVIFMPGL